jgi:hypothetical protein
VVETPGPFYRPEPRKKKEKREGKKRLSPKDIMN